MRQLRDRLVELAVEVDAQANRQHSAGGVCMQQSETVKRAAWAMARAAWLIGGNTTATLVAFFPGVGTGKRPEGTPDRGDELEDFVED